MSNRNPDPGDTHGKVEGDGVGVGLDESRIVFFTAWFLRHKLCTIENMDRVAEILAHAAEKTGWDLTLNFISIVEHLTRAALAVKFTGTCVQLTDQSTPPSSQETFVEDHSTDDLASGLPFSSDTYGKRCAISALRLLHACIQRGVMQLGLSRDTSEGVTGAHSESDRSIPLGTTFTFDL